MGRGSHVHVDGTTRLVSAQAGIKDNPHQQRNADGKRNQPRQNAAKRLIESRGRDNYATAADYLSRVRKLYQHLGEDKTWKALIADIRQQNSSPCAPKEELDKVGLYSGLSDVVVQ